MRQNHYFSTVNYQADIAPILVKELKPLNEYSDPQIKYQWITAKGKYDRSACPKCIQYGELKNVWTSAPVEQFLDKNKPLNPSGLIGPLKIFKLNIMK